MKAEKIAWMEEAVKSPSTESPSVEAFQAVMAWQRLTKGVRRVRMCSTKFDQFGDTARIPRCEEGCAMEDPVIVSAPNASVAWLRGVTSLLDRGGECFNLAVQVANPLEVDRSIHQAYEDLQSRHGLLSLKQVIYTIFPQSLYRQVKRDPGKLFETYNRRNGVFDRLRRRYGPRFGWGSYFRRMTCYPAVDNSGRRMTINQLGAIIEMLRDRERVYKAAYTITIQIPGTDGRRTIGGPCLSYLALQLESPKVLNLLAIYRNHDFIQRAYGNYLGLGHVMSFLCEHTDYTVGSLTCVSSHASIRNLSGRGSWPGTPEIRQLISRAEET